MNLPKLVVIGCCLLIVVFLFFNNDNVYAQLGGISPGSFCGQVLSFAHSTSTVYLDEIKVRNQQYGPISYSTTTVTGSPPLVTRIYYLKPVPPQPPNYDNAYRLIYSFTEIFNQGEFICDSQTKEAKIRFTEIIDKNPDIIRVSSREVKVGVNSKVIVEDLSIKETCQGGSCGLSLVSRNINSSEDSQYNLYPMSSIIVGPAPPKIYSWTTQTLFGKTYHIQATTDALALNGKIGLGSLSKNIQSKGKLLGIISIFVGAVFLLIAPQLTPFILQAGTMIVGSGLVGYGLISFINASLSTKSISLFLDIQNRNFGTIERPAGGLEQFTWRWIGGFREPQVRFDFSLSNSGDIRVKKGSTGSNVINVNLVSGTSSRVDLSVSGNLPGGITRSLSRTSGLPPFTATFTVNVPQQVSTGTYAVTITGVSRATSPPLTKTTSFRVIVFEDQFSPSQPPPSGSFDLGISSFDIRTFICKNDSFDSSYINDYSSRNPNYPYFPSTTAMTDYQNVNQLENKNIVACPETQRNRPVEFKAQGGCFTGTCPSSKLRLEVKPKDPNVTSSDSFIEESVLNNSYPKNLTKEHIFQDHYFYEVKVCLVDENNNQFSDLNPANNCQQQDLRVYNYLCNQAGFCAQNLKDPTVQPSEEKTLNTLRNTDAPCVFWKNSTCRSIIR